MRREKLEGEKEEAFLFVEERGKEKEAEEAEEIGSEDILADET